MQKISNIFNNEYLPLRPWSQRAINGRKSILIRKIRNILNLFSGFEISNLLKDLIRDYEMRVISVKYYNVLRKLSDPINSLKPKNKHFFFREFKLSHFKLNELKEMNYKISKKLWSSCKKKHERLEGGRKIIPEDKIMKKNSTISSYKFVREKIRKYKLKRSM